MIWTETSDCLCGIKNTLSKVNPLIRIAGFDLDDTLIIRSGAKNQCRLVDEVIIDKIIDLVKNKYLIIIFTNQSGMSKKKFDLVHWKKTVEELYQRLMENIPKYYFAVYAAKQHNMYRKPNIGMWCLMKMDLIEKFGKINISNRSFFCGDAAGRIKAGFYKKINSKNRKPDFSDTDRKFALNLGIKFYTPEECFIKEDINEEKFILKGLDPVKFLEADANTEEIPYEFIPRKKEMIIMVGQPGSGKSFFVNKFIVKKGYVAINQDSLRTKIACEKLVDLSIKENKSIVVDATNPNVYSRMFYTLKAFNAGYKHIRCIIMNTDIDLSKHLNNVRHVYSNGEIKKVNNIVYNLFAKNYVRPQKSEKFDLIENVNFVFIKKFLDDDRWRKIFMMRSEV